METQLHIMMAITMASQQQMVWVQQNRSCTTASLPFPRLKAHYIHLLLCQRLVSIRTYILLEKNRLITKKKQTQKQINGCGGYINGTRQNPIPSIQFELVQYFFFENNLRNNRRK